MRRRKPNGLPAGPAVLVALVCSCFAVGIEGGGGESAAAGPGTGGADATAPDGEAPTAEQTLDWPEGLSLPSWAYEAFEKRRERYRFSTWMNPFFQRGDFDGEPDLAVLVVEKETGKKGVAMLHRSGRTFILGAGNPFGFGGSAGDDFEWIAAWTPATCDEAAASYFWKRDYPNLRCSGDTFAIIEPERASAWVVWDGDGYRWVQSGD